jgi:hypothetical protein
MLFSSAYAEQIIFSNATPAELYDPSRNNLPRRKYKD